MDARSAPENASPTARMMLAVAGCETITVTMATVTIADPIDRALSKFNGPSLQGHESVGGWFGLVNPFGCALGGGGDGVPCRFPVHENGSGEHEQGQAARDIR